ncbi:MAG: DUF2294 family protein [Solirubrobacterales bacterium]|nr:DUF2294 family protein [Solirubrobacterales bacterium]MBV9715358.1 DUF2294 family protein [Solirubrobacterales bacterium]
MSVQSGGTAGEAAAAEPREDVARSELQELAAAMVRFYKDAFGRGPTRARAYYVGSDTVIVLLEHSLTVAESNLAVLGEHQRLRDARVFFHYAVEGEMRSLVERVLGRRTVAFVSGIDTRQDLAAEIFTLAPEPDRGGRPR